MESKMRQLRELERELKREIPREAYHYAWHLQDCLVSLNRLQGRLESLGCDFVDVVTSAKLRLGESFALGLVRHCHDQITKIPKRAKSWELFCHWWLKNDPNFPGTPPGMGNGDMQMSKWVSLFTEGVASSYAGRSS